MCAVLFLLFLLVGIWRELWLWGGEGGKEIKANGKFAYQYPILTSCKQLAPLAKCDVNCSCPFGK